MGGMERMGLGKQIALFTIGEWKTEMGSGVEMGGRLLRNQAGIRRGRTLTQAPLKSQARSTFAFSLLFTCYCWKVHMVRRRRRTQAKNRHAQKNAARSAQIS